MVFVFKNENIGSRVKVQFQEQSYCFKSQSATSRVETLFQRQNKTVSGVKKLFQETNENHERTESLKK